MNKKSWTRTSPILFLSEKQIQRPETHFSDAENVAFRTSTRCFPNMGRRGRVAPGMASFFSRKGEHEHHV